LHKRATGVNLTITLLGGKMNRLYRIFMRLVMYFGGMAGTACAIGVCAGWTAMAQDANTETAQFIMEYTLAAHTAVQIIKTLIALPFAVMTIRAGLQLLRSYQETRGEIEWSYVEPCSLF
jgi:heme A synthase